MSEQIEAGAIVEGKVFKIKPFGAIVTLPNNTQGLVHISHISTSFVQNIADHISPGDVVKVKVLSIDQASGKISLSMKEAQNTPKRRPEQRSAFADFPRKAPAIDETSTFEDKLKEWVKVSNERHAGLNKRNKRR